MNKKILIKSKKKIIYMTIIKKRKFLNKYLLNNDKVSNHRNKIRVNKKEKIILRTKTKGKANWIQLNNNNKLMIINNWKI